MNGKKAKALRRFAKENGMYSKEPEYKIKETKKIVYVPDSKGELKAREVSRYTLLNVSKIKYRNLKKMYKSGQITI